jgi:hypothetical protein
MKGKKKHKMLRIKMAGGTLDGIFPVRFSDGHRMINRRAAGISDPKAIRGPVLARRN